MSTVRVLLVEDEEAFIEALVPGLGREGFEVIVARDGAEALRLFPTADADVVLLDLMLPRVSGVDVCRAIRAESSVPIIMVTARAAEIDVVVGLEVGADDYVTKPYRMRELVARIRAVLRRSDDQAAPPEPSRVLTADDVSVDLDSHEVTVGGELVNVPRKEFDLLVLFLEHQGRVLSRDLLIDRVWGHDYVGDTKTLDVHVKRLRAKIEPTPSEPERIVTVRGIGYKYQRPAT